MAINSTDEVLAGQKKRRRRRRLAFVPILKVILRTAFPHSAKVRLVVARKSFCNKNDEEDDQMMCKNAPTHRLACVEGKEK